jgi:hypothetical protein
MNIHLVSFGSTHNYGGALTRLKIQASQWRQGTESVFASINIFDEKHLQRNHTDFWNLHASHIQANPRGYGYWVWKSYLTRHVMKQVPQGDVVFWMDVGCQFNFAALSRFQQYYNIAQQQGLLCFDVGMPEYMWCKGDTAQRVVNNSPEFLNSGQLISGIVMWRNDDLNRQLVDDWAAISVADGYRYVTDVASQAPNWTGFREHRHDQSVLSLLIKKYGCYQALPDETYFPNWHADGKMFPVWATRNPTTGFV